MSKQGGAEWQPWQLTCKYSEIIYLSIICYSFSISLMSDSFMIYHYFYWLGIYLSYGLTIEQEQNPNTRLKMVQSQNGKCPSALKSILLKECFWELAGIFASTVTLSGWASPSCVSQHLSNAMWVSLSSFSKSTGSLSSPTVSWGAPTENAPCACSYLGQTCLILRSESTQKQPWVSGPKVCGAVPVSCSL